ncbi:MAG: hypothetical protein JOY85_16355, partial [Acidobacteriaceae bacterium]|nr:hypothetical protein [Acidobacteriaceae bacterium]
MLRQACTAFLLLTTQLLRAQTPTLEQSLSMKQPVALRISPDRHYVSYVVQQANWDENAFDTQIWMADAVSGDCYQLTSGKKSSGNPRWAPDSKRLA